MVAGNDGGGKRQMADTRLIQSRYRLLELIGRGGMGEVWRARDESLGRLVAVKCLKPMGPQHDQAFTRVLRERFRREARVAASLQHRGVTVVHDFGEHEGVLYLVMELLDGHNLSQLLEGNQQRPLPVDHVVDIAEQVADALGYTHRQGIVHRDLKPANIMRLSDGTVKICDFGIARLGRDIGVTSRLTTTGIAMGTPHYMSPEQIGGKEVDHRSDLYSLGCVLYEIATGVPPFDLEDPWSILVGHRDTQPEPPRTHRAELPGFFDRVVLDLLAKAPDERPADASDLRRRILLGRTGGQTGPGAVHPPTAPYQAAPTTAPHQDPTARNPNCPLGPGHDPRTQGDRFPEPGGRPTRSRRRTDQPVDHRDEHRRHPPPGTDGSTRVRPPPPPNCSPRSPAATARASTWGGWAAGRRRARCTARSPHSARASSGPTTRTPSPAGTRSASPSAAPAGPPTRCASSARSPRPGTHPGPRRPADSRRPAGDRVRPRTARPLLRSTPGVRRGPRRPRTFHGPRPPRHPALPPQPGVQPQPSRTPRGVVAAGPPGGRGPGRLLGATHPDTLATRYEVAYTLGRLGRWAEALETYQDVARARAATLGPTTPTPSPPATRRASASAGSAAARRPWSSTGRWSPTVRGWAALRRRDAPRPPRPGRQPGRMGRWEEALAEAREVCALRGSTLGPDHPDTVISCREVAVALGWLGRWSDALTAYRQVTEARGRALGPDHPETLAARSDEAHCLDRLGRKDEAAELYRTSPRTGPRTRCRRTERGPSGGSARTRGGRTRPAGGNGPELPGGSAPDLLQRPRAPWPGRRPACYEGACPHPSRPHPRRLPAGPARPPGTATTP